MASEENELGGRLIPQREARKLAGGVSNMTWWRWSHRYPDFPRVHKISGRNYYALAETKAWLHSRREAA